MPLEQTVTIINNSGKIISTGKELLSIFKEAQSSYKDKKAEVKQERTLKRAQTYDNSRSLPRHDDYEQNFGRSGRSVYQQNDYFDGPAHYENYEPDPRYAPQHHDYRPQRAYDEYSVASSRRSHGARSTHSRHYHGHPSGRQTALTEGNLKTLTEVSSTAPSRRPTAYRSPYAETIPLGHELSRMDLRQPPMRNVEPKPTEWRQELMLRSQSDGQLIHQRKKSKEIDMNLAYGNIPPDLASREDLDPANEEATAQMLVRKIEGLLDEAHCAQHSAGAIIKHLQEKPDAAAAVALTLAELSSVATKMSPAVLALFKSGSPAVFALLASPQFLIGTGIALGITVVMFGGWKIVQRAKAAHMAREALTYQTEPAARPMPVRAQTEYNPRAPSEYHPEYDEALVVDEDFDDELSTIESWRRGIVPTWEEETADIELITPEAKDALYAKKDHDQGYYDDLRSRRNAKMAKPSKPSKPSKMKGDSKDKAVPQKEKDRMREKEKEKEKRPSRGSAASVISSSSTTSHRKSSSSSKKKDKSDSKSVIDDGHSSRGDDDLLLRPRTQRPGHNMLKTLFKNKKERKEEEDTLYP